MQQSSKERISVDLAICLRWLKTGETQKLGVASRIIFLSRGKILTSWETLLWGHIRSLPKDEMNGKKFVLIAFVNDVDQSVTEGSDGVEHM